MENTIRTERYMLNIEVIQDAVEDLAEALAEFSSVARRIGSPTYYGRDARNIGVRDGTHFRPDEEDWENAYRKAVEAVNDAIDLGILKEVPYELKRYSLFN